MEGDVVADVHRSMSGDRRAFERLIRRYGDPVRGFLLRMVGDFHAAQDLAQETFLKAYTSLGNLDRPHRFRAWLFRIAFHVAVDFRRSRAPSEVSLDSLAGGSVADSREPGQRRIEDEDERTKLFEDVVQALATLPEQYGLPMVLRYLQQRSHVEMARLLDLSLSNVKVRLHRARRMMRSRVTARAGRAGDGLEERSV